VVKLRLDDEILIDDEIKSTTLRHMAIGVGAGLVPWNFPMYLGEHRWKRSKSPDGALSPPPVSFSHRQRQDGASVTHGQHFHHEAFTFYALLQPQGWGTRDRYLPARRLLGHFWRGRPRPDVD
jgi:hypothetical protein